MDFFVARLMSLNEHELRCLRSDHELQNHLQRTHLLMESKLQQYSNASSSSTASSLASAAAAAQGALPLVAQVTDNYALDLRLQDQQRGQLSERSRQQLHQIHQLQQQLYHHHQQQQQQQQLHQLQLQHHQRLQQQQYHLQPQQNQLQHQLQEKCFNPKKRKCFEWTSNGTGEELCSPTPPASSASTASTTLARDDQVNSPPVATTNSSSNNNHTPLSTPTPTATAASTPTSNYHLNQVALTITHAPKQQPAIGGGGKKYKGEFDEPNAFEVELRVKLLMRDDNYHSKNSPRGECACILGSEFRDKSASSVLVMIEQWRQMPTEQRVTFKWDMNDLPKDIPLSDIKRFENLRREASSGRADFGGASKRKPLGIRGTRQFLLILYCLWGHPGREDPMQREGYCPHCFAKIKKPNEQSTLVRVVNHFNMKHRRGANPRT